MARDASIRAIVLPGAYCVADETMTCNLTAEDGVDGIDAFVDKRTAVGKG